MKKIMLCLLVLAGLAFSSKVQAQRVGYYYYPDANVYYNPHTHQYAYEENGNWTYHATVPRTYDIPHHSHVVIYGDNDEIWRDNASHREKYKDWDRRHKKKWKKHHD